MEITDPQFWVAVLQIIAIDIALGADNAVVIALACRRLPERQRNFGIFWGITGAIGIRVLLVFFALHLLTLPFLKITGAVLLLWIGIKLLLPEPADEGGPVIDSSTTLSGAIKTIIVADTVMSLDNVMGIAGAARDSIELVIFGLIFSVPIIVWGSKLVMRLMERFPIVIVIGAGLLGWVAGDMLTTDTVVREWIDLHAAFLHWLAPVFFVVLVIAVGKWLAAAQYKKIHAISGPLEKE